MNNKYCSMFINEKEVLYSNNPGETPASAFNCDEKYLLDELRKSTKECLELNPTSTPVDILLNMARKGKYDIVMAFASLGLSSTLEEIENA